MKPGRVNRMYQNKAIIRDEVAEVIDQTMEKVDAEKTVYVVTAYRWGNRENHSYIVGAFTDLDKANEIADDEEDHRGGKYECEIAGITLDAENNSSRVYHRKISDG